MTLKKKVFKAGNWVVLGHFTSQFVRLGGNLVLTRLLVPEMFGLMAIVSVFLGGVAMFSDLGINQNIIQSKNAGEKKYINTAWSIQILRGIVMFLVILALSVFLYHLHNIGLLVGNSVYAHPQLPFILAAMSVTGLISGFNSLNMALLNRGLELKKIVIIEVISQLAGLLFMILFAYFQRNIWALVFGTIVSSFIKMMLSHHSSLGEKSRLAWDRDAAYEIFHFGKWVFGASIFTFLMGQGDRLILGWLITPKELGVYTVAFFLATALKVALKKVISSVFFPALSDVARNRRQDLKSVYYRVRGQVDLSMMIVVGLMASMGHILVDLLYDDRYQDAGWIFEILSFSLLFMGTSIAGVCLMALGNSKAIMTLTATAALSLFICLPLAYHYYGLWGASVAIALNPVVEIPLMLYMMKKHNIFCWRKEFRMWPIALVSYGVGKTLASFL